MTILCHENIGIISPIRKSKINLSCLLFIVYIALCNSAYAEGLCLVENGSTSYRILIGPGTPPTEEFAAQELQGYVMQISGAFLPLDQGSPKSSVKYIIIGKNTIIGLGLKINEDYLGQDGFVIKTIGDMLLLVGGSSRGTLYSVYSFLEMLGCRWMAPGIIGEVIPQTPDIIIDPIEHIEVPGFIYRGFANLLPVSQEGSQWIDWMAKNKMNYFLGQFSNYDDFKKILGGEIEKRSMYVGVNFDDLTELYDKASLSDATQIDLPKLLEYILKFISDNPEVDIIQFPEEILDTVGEKYLSFMDDVKKKIKEKYPERSIQLMFCNRALSSIAHTGFNTYNPASRKCYRHSMGDEKCGLNQEVRLFLEENIKNLGKIHVSEYYMGSYSQNSLPFPILNTIMLDLEYFSRLSNVEGIISQCEQGNWGTYGLNYYVLAKMSWKPDIELGIIVDDYCDKYYGSASEPMKRYYAKLEDLMAKKEHFQFIIPPQMILDFFSEEFISDLDMELRNAEDLANDAMNYDRIRKAHLSFEHVKLLFEMLDNYTKAIQLYDSGESKGAKEYFQKSIERGEKLVAFLFKNINEGIFIVPESYIFDYLEVIIGDSRDKEAMIK